MLSERERRFLAQQRIAHLATADRGAVPHVVPVCFAVAGGTLYITIDEKPKRRPASALKRLENIAENPAVAVVGARYETRFKLLRERVLAMKELWTKEQAEFHGQFVNFDPVWLYPKPKQKPHPPILLGGESDHTVRRVIEFCDGWFPRTRGGWEPKGAAARRRQAGLAGGRDPATLSITVFNAPADAAALAPYREAGIARVLFEVPDAGRDDVLRRLDRYGPLTV